MKNITEPCPAKSDLTGPHPTQSNLAQPCTKDSVLAHLLKAHKAYYDIQRDYSFGGRTFPGYAEFHTHGEKYVLSKKAKLWEVDAHEYLFFTTAETASPALVDNLIAFMTTEALLKVKATPNHMTSYLSLIIIADHASEQSISTIKHARFRKNFQFGLRGWSDLRVALIDLETMQVYTNGQGKELKPTLEANLKAVTHNTSSLNEQE